MKNTEEQKPAIRSFPSFFFSSGFGYACYYMLRNDWVWSRLTDQEKAFVKKHNEYWNNNNPGYKNPEEYQGQQGKSFRTPGDRRVNWEGQMIQLFLDRERPRSVLEVGPGSGYYTRQIIDCDCVVEYVATDINIGFLESVQKAIGDHPRASSVTAKFLPIDKLEAQGFEVDAIIALSALHHVPDRAEFVKWISNRLKPGGALFFYEPMHSMTRVLQLAMSFLLNRWYSTKVIQARNNFMTHHFCTVAETRAIAKFADLDLEWWDVISSLPLPHIRGLIAPVGKSMVATLRRRPQRVG
jgi:SAM-dependent methyltransferase